MKIGKNDMYIDTTVSGNTIWYAPSDLDGENYILIAQFGSTLWTDLFNKISVDLNSESTRELLKSQRLSLLGSSLTKTKKSSDDVLEKIKELLNGF